MSSAFSLADRLHLAVNSCLPCLNRAPSNDSPTNPASSQLRGLLIDPDSDSVLDPETLSLHSNPGRVRRPKKSKKLSSVRSSRRSITLFGYNLFGRPTPPPIHLPDGDHDALYSAPGPLESALTVHSSATFDSDAAPLDADTIDNLSGPTAAALAEAEEEERRKREERRRRRKEKKEMKKLAQALAVSGEGQFEGFQGSGDGYPGIPSPFLPADQEHESDFIYQRLPSPTSLLPHAVLAQEGDDEEADLDGVVYTRRRVPGNPSNGGSDSRSRTSTSVSDRYSAVGSPYPQHPPMTTTPRMKKSSSSSSASPKKKRTKSKSTSSHASSAYARTKSTSSSNSNSNYTNTDATSLVTPTSPQSIFPHDDLNKSHNTSVATIISPSTIEHGQGLFDLEDELPQAQVRVTPVMPHSAKSHHRPMEDAERGSIFPSTGLGGTRPAGKMRGAFLADLADTSI